MTTPQQMTDERLAQIADPLMITRRPYYVRELLGHIQWQQARIAELEQAFAPILEFTCLDGLDDWRDDGEEMIFGLTMGELKKMREVLNANN